jgi:hypothetical protein
MIEILIAGDLLRVARDPHGTRVIQYCFQLLGKCCFCLVCFWCFWCFFDLWIDCLGTTSYISLLSDALSPLLVELAMVRVIYLYIIE